VFIAVRYMSLERLVNVSSRECYQDWYFSVCLMLHAYHKFSGLTCNNTMFSQQKAFSVLDSFGQQKSSEVPKA